MLCSELVTFQVYFRISYCVYLLEKLKYLYPNHDIQLMYDVACLLVKHLMVCIADV